METKSTKQSTNLKFYCSVCDYTCCNKSNYNKHLLTRKHKMETNGNTKSTKQKIGQNNDNDFLIKSCQNDDDKNKNHYTCQYCNKIYQSRAGYWKHEKKCKYKKENIENEEEKNISIAKNNEDDINYKSMFMSMMKKNDELQETIKEMIPRIGDNVTNNTTNHNKISMNIFLNEHCKDALNLMDFVKSLQLQMDDLECTRTQGFVEGISRIFIRGLQNLDVTKRPIHCSDLKREILYVKDNNAWQKESQDKEHMVNAIKEIKHNNFLQMKDWVDNNPEYGNVTHEKNSEYLQLISNCIGGVENEQDKNLDKVIKNVAKQVYIKTNDI